MIVFSAKFSKFSESIYMPSYIQWGGCHVSPLRQRRSPGVLRRSGRVLETLKRTDKCTATWHCTPLDCNRIVRKSEKRQLTLGWKEFVRWWWYFETGVFAPVWPHFDANKHSMMEWYIAWGGVCTGNFWVLPMSGFETISRLASAMINQLRK